MALSFVLGLLGIAGQLVMTRSLLWGWTISLCVQPLWVVFAVTVGQYGLLLTNVGFTVAAVLNLRKAGGFVRLGGALSRGVAGLRSGAGFMLARAGGAVLRGRGRRL